MKKLLLALLLVWASAHLALAQAPPEQQFPLTAFTDSINRIFQGVDKSRMPSGILEEYGLQVRVTR